MRMQYNAQAVPMARTSPPAMRRSQPPRHTPFRILVTRRENECRRRRRTDRCHCRSSIPGYGPMPDLSLPLRPAFPPMVHPQWPSTRPAQLQLLPQHNPAVTVERRLSYPAIRTAAASWPSCRWPFVCVSSDPVVSHAASPVRRLGRAPLRLFCPVASPNRFW